MGSTTPTGYFIRGFVTGIMAVGVAMLGIAFAFIFFWGV